jgi:hypothetical protein
MVVPEGLEGYSCLISLSLGNAVPFIWLQNRRFSCYHFVTLFRTQEERFLLNSESN